MWLGDPPPAPHLPSPPLRSSGIKTKSGRWVGTEPTQLPLSRKFWKSGEMAW